MPNKYFTKDTDIIKFADISVKQIPEEVANFLLRNIVFQDTDEVQAEDLCGATCFDEDQTWIFLTEEAKAILKTIEKEAAEYDLCYIRIVDRSTKDKC